MKNIQIKKKKKTILTTDRYVQIRSFLIREYPKILLQFDVWHFGKSVKKALSEIAKKKRLSAGEFMD